MIDESRVRPSIENVEFVLNYPIPRNTKETQKFVFLASYFRRFVPQFSSSKTFARYVKKKNVNFRFGLRENNAFET